MNPPNSTTAPATHVTNPGAEASADAAPADSNKGRASLLWLIGLVALALTGTYLALLPGIRERESYALLDQVPIKLIKNVRNTREGPEDVVRTNPVTGEKVPFITYNVYVGNNSEDHPDLAARRAFIALGDLCGRNPRLGMKVFREGLKSPMDATGFRRRMVADELLIYLRDVRDLDPNDPELQLNMDDLYRVAQIANGEEFMAGAAQRGADILSLLLAFPADFPDRIPVLDFDAKEQSATTRTVYLATREYNARKFREPFFEQGRDCLLMLDTLKPERFTWDPTLRRFLFSGVQPAAPATPPSGPAAPAAPKAGAANPLEQMGPTAPAVTPPPAPAP